MLASVQHHAAALSVRRSANVAAIGLDVGVREEMQLQHAVCLEGLATDGTAVWSVVTVNVVNVKSQGGLAGEKLAAVIAAIAANDVILQGMCVQGDLRDEGLAASAALKGSVHLGSTSAVTIDPVTVEGPIVRQSHSAALAHQRPAVHLFCVGS